MFFPSSTIAFLLPLTTLIHAIPTKRQAPNYPPHSQSQNFLLVANVTDLSHDLSPSIDNWVLSSYHIGAGEDYAVLSPNYADGRVFYVNGTAEEVRFNEGDLLTDGGTPAVPWGVSILPQSLTNSLGQHTVQIDAGLGEPGIGLANFPNPIPTLTAPAQGNYYACNNTVPVLPFGPAVQLLFAYEGESIPEACAAVVLLPQCSSGAVEEFGNTVNCYEDVATIDWEVYDAYLVPYSY